MGIDVALATCADLPEPDVDMEPLLGALRAAGISCEALAWDDARADFASARLTILRSTWNYSERVDDFLAWVDGVASVSRLVNPPHVARWSAHKGYLLDLETRGVPVTPTCLVRRGDRTPLTELMEARGWREVVVKPAVSAASRNTRRVRPTTLDRGEAHLRGLAD